MSAFADRPFIAIWEVTRACALACVHCRAAAIPRRDLGELPSLAEQIAALDVALWALFFLIPVGRAQVNQALPAAFPHPSRARMRADRAVTEGNGFVFIDHVGKICPSGFLPLSAGNVRADDLVSVYRTHPFFLALRDSAGFGGRCGRCEWRERCGGSRARAWAFTGDPLGEDPGCAWEPVTAGAA